MITLPLPAQVGIVGGGRMGAGIAHAFLLGGCAVTVVDMPDRADATRQTIAGHLARSVERGHSQSTDDMLSRLQLGTEIVEIMASGLVIEAVPEDVELKAEVLGRVSAILAPEAVLATNTSSISIDRLASYVASADRFLGMHFFNPVPASRLVELVVGATTAGRVTDTAVEWVRALDKTPITVRDVPGFATSRLGVVLGLEAIRMLENGVATAGDIDLAMSLGYKHPIGPLELTDIIGLDVRLAIAEYLCVELGPRFEPPVLLRNMVAEGRLGRKSGEGFYIWPLQP